MLGEQLGTALMIAVGAVRGGEQHAGIDQKHSPSEVAGGHARGLLRPDLTVSLAKIASARRPRTDERCEWIVGVGWELRGELRDHSVDLHAAAGGFSFESGE